MECHRDEYNDWKYVGNSKQDVEHTFNCFFPYLGSGGDWAPKGAKRDVLAIDGGLGGFSAMVEPARGTVLGEDGVVEPEEEVQPQKGEKARRDISAMRRWWRKLFGR